MIFSYLMAIAAIVNLIIIISKLRTSLYSVPLLPRMLHPIPLELMITKTFAPSYDKLSPS